jgi:hypothetical protein
MKLYEKMRKGENMSWCRPYKTEDSKVWLIEKEGAPEELIIEGVRITKPENKLIETLAYLYNSEYYKATKGQIKPEAILIDAMNEWGCAECPDRNVCELMDILEE